MNQIYRDMNVGYREGREMVRRYGLEGFYKRPLSTHEKKAIEKIKAISKWANFAFNAGLADELLGLASERGAKEREFDPLVRDALCTAYNNYNAGYEHLGVSRSYSLRNVPFLKRHTVRKFGKFANTVNDKVYKTPGYSPGMGLQAIDFAKTAKHDLVELNLLIKSRVMLSESPQAYL